MATQRRLTLTLTHHFRSLLSSTPPLTNPQTVILRSLRLSSFRNPCSNPFVFRSQIIIPLTSISSHEFSSRPTYSPSEDDEEEEEEDDNEDDEEGEYDEVEGDNVVDDESCNGAVQKFQVSGKSEEQKAIEAADIGYKVVGPLDPSERPFKPWEPVFAVVQIGSHQFKVSNGDSIFTERLKFCEVNDKLVLNKVLMLGSKTQTIIGRPILPDAAVHAIVEEHALDAKVIIFKKKRRKNYRRTKGHRQELTKLRITDIQGIEKSEGVAVPA